MRHNAKTKKSTALGITAIDLNLKVPILSVHSKDRNKDEAPWSINDIDCSKVSPTVISFAIALGYTNSSKNISRGGVAQWNFDLDTETDSKSVHNSPIHEVEMTSHLNCISTHPQRRSVWGVGSTYGEVMIVDFTVKEGKDPVVACSKMCPYAHIQAIASVEWFRPDVDSEWTICSVGRDGRIIVWGSSLNYPVRCIPMSQNDVAIIATATAIQQPTRMNFGDVIVGSAGGSVSVYQIEYSNTTASMISACKMKWSANALKMLCHMQQEHREDAVKKIEYRVKHKKRKGVDCLAVLDAKITFSELFPSLTPKVTEKLHAGEITCVAVHPFCRNIFLTGGSDGAVKLYVKSVPCCILGFYLPPTSAGNSLSLPVVDAKFSPTRETVVVLATKNGTIFVWDFSRSVDFPSSQYNTPEKEYETNEIASLKFCNKDGVVVVAYHSGDVKFIRLPDAMYRPCTANEKLEIILGLK